MRLSNRYPTNKYQANNSQTLGGLAIASSLVVLLSQSARATESARFETSLFGGYSYGGDFYGADDKGNDTDQLKIKSSSNFGIALNLRQEANAYYELFYSKQSASIELASAYDMSIEYLHIGGFVEFPDIKRKMIPYAVLTVGATRFMPTRSDFDRTIEPSLALRGGVKIPFTKNIGLRLEARGYATFVKPESKLFCVSTTDTVTCETNIQGHSFLQAQGLIGLTIGF